MKKLTIFSSIAAAALAMVGCQEKEIETFQPGNEGSTFELIAEIAQTKTTLDADYKVAWEEGDVIYMVTSGAETPWATAEEFIYADGKFNTESTIKDGTYTMNALYAVADQAVFHKNTGTTHKLQPIQTQDCANPTAHIKANDALVGTFTTTVPSDEPATVNMNHIYTLMQVDIKNTTGSAIDVTKFEMTAAGANLAGIFNVTSFDTPALSLKQSASSTITVNVTGGSVENTASRPVYFVMAPLSDYSGDVTFRVTDSESNTYTKTVTLNNISFAAGTFNTTPYTISEADVVAPNVTWDLTTASYESASAEKVVWSSEFVNLTLEKGESSTPANNILGGTGGNNHTRVYKDHVMTFAPVGKYQIESVEFTVLSGYTDEFAEAVWTNGEASTSGDIVTVTPVEGHKKVSAVLGAATRFSAIKVYYSYDEEYVLPTVKSLEVSGQTKEYVQNATFSFDGTVKAIYTNDEEVDVTDKVSVSTPDLTTIGTKEVTITYIDGENPITVTYEITVVEASAVSGWILTSFENLKEGDQVVIVGTKSADKYAMTNDKGTGNPPIPVEIAISGNKLTQDPATNVVWHVGVENSYRIFYTSAAKTTWLYCTNTNNGVRVGTNENKTFSWDNDYLMHVNTNRYLGIYNTQDWRCYTSTTSNIANQTFQFFVKVGGTDEGIDTPDPTPVPIELEMSKVTCSNSTETSLTFTWTAVDGAIAYQVYFDSEDKGQTTELTYMVSGLEAGTSHTIAVKAIGDGINYTTSNSAETCTASTNTAQGGGDEPDQPGEGGGDQETVTTTYTFNSKAWGDPTDSWTSGKDGNQYTANQGVQVTTGASGANATCKNTLNNVSSVLVSYCTNSTKGAGTITITIGSVSKSFTVTKPSSGGTTLKTASFDFSSECPTGTPKITVDCTTNSVYVNALTFTHTN